MSSTLNQVTLIGNVGNVEVRKYTDNNNIERKEINIVASNVVLMSKKAAQPQPQTQSNNDYPWPI